MHCQGQNFLRIFRAYTVIFVFTDGDTNLAPRGSYVHMHFAFPPLRIFALLAMDH